MRVLVLRALGLGDLLTTVPALRGIRRAFPAATVTLACPGSLGELARLTGVVDEILDTSFELRPAPAVQPAKAAHCSQPARADQPAEADRPAYADQPQLLPIEVKRHRQPVDLAVNLHGRGPQSTGWLHDFQPRRLISYGVTSTWRPDEHEVARWCRLVAEAGVPADPADLTMTRPAVPPLVGDAIVVHPGAAIASRRWPADRWAAVARALAEEQEHPVVVSGGPGETDLAQAVAAAAGLPPNAVLAGRTSVLDLAALVAAATLVIGPDTGIGHLATAFGTPSVLLFGPTPPAHWGPPPGRPQHRVLWAGRIGDPFGDKPDPGLLLLTVAEVLDAATAAMGAGCHP